MKDSYAKLSLKPYPDRDLLSYISEVAVEYPRLPAILYESTALSYCNLLNLIDIFSAFLEHIGIEIGDRLAILLPNCPQFVIAQLGAWRAGAIVAPVNPSYPLAKTAKILFNIKPKVVITFWSLYNQLAITHNSIITNMSKVIITTTQAQELSSAFNSGNKSKSNMTEHKSNPSLKSEYLWLETILDKYKNSSKAGAVVKSSNDAIILMSSGTTGEGKKILGDHKSFVITGLQLLKWLDPVIRKEQEMIMLSVPLFHAYGNVAVQSFTFLSHNTLCLIPELRDIQSMINTIEKVKPSILATVPRLLIALVNHNRIEKNNVDLTCIKLCFTGGTSLPSKIRQKVENLTKGRVVQGYSLTEAMMACIMDPVVGTNKEGSVGLPLPDVEARIVSRDPKRLPIDISELGEIMIKAPQLMIKYWNNASETARVIKIDSNGDRWLLTGDLGRIDKDGFLFVLERKKDLIELGTHLVFPSEIEEVILQHDAVAQVGAAGVRSSDGSEYIKAWIVLNKGMFTNKDDIKNFCSNKLEAYKIPKDIEICASLPTSESGKVIRSLLHSCAV